MYAIWKYFSKEAREAAASVTYFYPSISEYPGDERGYCPIANAFTIDDPEYCHRSQTISKQRPDPLDIALLLQKINQITREERKLVTRLAERFVQDWDRGKIEDIWKAVGLKKKEQP